MTLVQVFKLIIIAYVVTIFILVEVVANSKQYHSIGMQVFKAVLISVSALIILLVR